MNSIAIRPVGTREVVVLAMLAAGFLFAASARSADIGQRTTMICVPEEARQLVSFGERAGWDETSKGRVRSSFGRWLFSNNHPTSSSTIRFQWLPEGSSGPALKIHTSRTHHVLVNVRSQGRDSVVVVSSASDPLSLVGWLFSINFKQERVMAASVQSNAGGAKSMAVRLSCNFENPAPEVDMPVAGNSIG